MKFFEKTSAEEDILAEVEQAKRPLKSIYPGIS